MNGVMVAVIFSLLATYKVQKFGYIYIYILNVYIYIYIVYRPDGSGVIGILESLSGSFMLGVLPDIFDEILT